MDTEELLYDIKKRIDEISISHQYNNTVKKDIDKELLNLIIFMRDDYYRLHHQSPNKILEEFKKLNN